jgi:hypothetical protein
VEQRVAYQDKPKVAFNKLSPKNQFIYRQMKKF